MKQIIYSLALILIFSSNAFSQFDFDSCMVAYYPFTGSVDDFSGNQNHGVNEGATLTLDRFGIMNSAYEFDGVDDYISIIPVSDLSQVGDFTISLWYYFEEWEVQTGGTSTNYDRQYIFDGHGNTSDVTSNFILDGFNINVNLTDNYEESVINSIKDVDGSTYQFFLDSFPDFNYSWHHNVFMRVGDKTYHYLDDELVHVGSVDSELLDMQHILYLGTFCGNNPNYNSYNYNFDGKIDDIRIYTCSLDSAAVHDLYTVPPVSVNAVNNLSNRIEIYPNPAKEFVSVDLTNIAIGGDFNLSIINSIGSVVFKKTVNKGLIKINTSDIGNNGIYFVRVTCSSKDFIRTQKLILN